MKTNNNGVQINYELSGKEDAPPVLLSHSLASSMVMWQPQLKVLEESFRVIRYDMRGHGNSDAPGGPASGDGSPSQAIPISIGIISSILPSLR